MDSVATRGVVATMSRKPRDEDERRDLSGEACGHSDVWERKTLRSITSYTATDGHGLQAKRTTYRAIHGLSGFWQLTRDILEAAQS